MFSTEKNVVYAGETILKKRKQISRKIYLYTLKVWHQNKPKTDFQAFYFINIARCGFAFKD